MSKMILQIIRVQTNVHQAKTLYSHWVSLGCVLAHCSLNSGSCLRWGDGMWSLAAGPSAPSVSQPINNSDWIWENTLMFNWGEGGGALKCPSVYNSNAWILVLGYGRMGQNWCPLDLLWVGCRLLKDDWWGKYWGHYLQWSFSSRNNMYIFLNVHSCTQNSK